MGDGKQPRKRNDYTEQLRVDGKQFRNAAEFCREYDLGYRTVVAHLKKGHSGAEIVRTMLELPDIPKKEPRQPSSHLCRHRVSFHCGGLPETPGQTGASL